MSVRDEYLPPEVSTLPPNSAEAEAGVLGCILLDPNWAIPIAQERLRVGSAVFYDLRHTAIYEAMLTLFAEGVPVESVAVMERLKDADKMPGADTTWMLYLLQLADAVPSASNLLYWLDILISKYVFRQVYRICGEESERAKQYATSELPDALAMVGLVEKRILEIRQQVETGRETADVTTVIESLQSDYEAAQRGDFNSVRTGLDDLDRMTGGMRGQEMVVLAAPPSVGKTSLALTIACNTVFRYQIPTGIITMETSAKKVVHRMACCVGRIDGTPLLRGTFTPETLRSMSEVFSGFSAARERLMIFDRGGLNGDELMSECRRMYRKGARFFIIDYLQLMNCKGDGLHEQVTKASSACKSVAKELDCPVLVISSLNREAMREGRMPRMSDLRQSGQIEYDADQIWFLYSEEPDADIQKIELRVAKNKDGPTGTVDLMFMRRNFRFGGVERTTT